MEQPKFGSYWQDGRRTYLITIPDFPDDLEIGKELQDALNEALDPKESVSTRAMAVAALAQIVEAYVSQTA